MINTIEDLSNVCAAGKNNAFFIDYDLSVRRCSLPIYDNSPFNRYNNIGFIEKNGKMVLNKNYLAKWCQCKSVPEDCLKCKYYAFCFSCVCPYSVLKGKRECEDFRFMVDFKLKIWNSTCKGRGNA